MAGETVVKISQLALEEKGMERYKTFEHDTDFYLYPLNKIRYKDSLNVKFTLICLGYGVYSGCVPFAKSKNGF